MVSQNSDILVFPARDFRGRDFRGRDFVTQIKRKLKRKRKRKRENLREGREAPPRRSLPLLRFCFRFRFNLRLIEFEKTKHHL